MKLEWVLGGLSPEKTDTALGPSIYSAVQSQLGLKLEARKGPLDVLVVDSARQIPTEN